MNKKDTFVHPSAIVNSEDIGEGTRIWEFASIMKGSKVGSNCNICGGCFIEEGAVIGSNVVIKNNVSIWKGVTIEDNAFVGPGVVFTNEKEPRSLHPKELARTIICEGASLGAGSIIIAPVSVGSYASIGAGAIVTRNIDPHKLALGNPARPTGVVCQCGRKISDSPDESAEGTCTCGIAFVITDGVYKKVLF